MTENQKLTADHPIRRQEQELRAAIATWLSEPDRDRRRVFRAKVRGAIFGLRFVRWSWGVGRPFMVYNGDPS